MPLTITNLEGALGAEATGADLARLSDADFAALRRAFEVRSVLVIRDQRIGPADLIGFSARLGPLEQHVLTHFLLPGHPEILIVSNEVENGRPVGLGDAGRYWHSDLSYMAEPSLGSALHAQVLPQDGGDTLFASMHAVYEALPASSRRRLDRLKAVHDYARRRALTPEQRLKVPPVVHPVVRVHPATGRRALFVNEGFTAGLVGVPEAESREVLDGLFQLSREERFTYRHRWQPYDIVLWDNRAVIHYATGCPADQVRRMYRTTIRGDRPIGP